MERRGLFETIFGKKKQPDKEYSQFKLLNSYQTQFIPFSGNAWDVDTVRAAVHSFARRAAVIQPQHIRYNGGRIDPVRDEMNYIMQYRPIRTALHISSITVSQHSTSSTTTYLSIRSLTIRRSSRRCISSMRTRSNFWKRKGSCSADSALRAERNTSCLIPRSYT